MFLQGFLSLMAVEIWKWIGWVWHHCSILVKLDEIDITLMSWYGFGSVWLVLVLKEV